MKKLILIIVITTNTITLMAQSSLDSSLIAKNTIFVEILGNGGWLSVNYDHLTRLNIKFKLSTRIGFCVVPAKIYDPSIFFPIEISILYGKRKHHLEFGVYINNFISLPDDMGEEFSNNFSDSDFGFYSGFRLGYRYQKPMGGLFLKIGITPILLEYIYGEKSRGLFAPLPGLGIGYTLKKRK